ncbi:peptide/nickel transport system substrate-binding protein [Rhizobiales bacterium GAS188]|nr:peptide/nickel transport system substrate-binding protein [Rhizobiales bacterium GAS188]
MNMEKLDRLDRRQLLIGGAAASLALGLAGPAHAESAPKKGGRFRLGTTGSVGDSHDPGTFGTSGVVNIGLWGAVYNNLTEIAPDGRAVPELAESFEASKDAKTWSFGLRKGVTFHNGKALDAEDVVASINHHRGADSKSAAKGLLANVAEVKADGKDSVVFTLNAGTADFPVVLTDYHLVIGPSIAGKIDWESAVGTGGYKLAAHERGARMTLKRTGQYFKPDRAFFDDVELIAISDTAARMNAVVTGEVDAIGRADIKTLALLQRNPEIVIDETSGTQHFTLPMFTDVAPFNNVDVRLALKYAIDRKALVQTILRGHGVPGNDSPITPSNRYFAKDIPIREYDPEKAKFHLKKAGMEALKVDLSAADAAFNGAVDTAILFKEQALKAGIEINVTREPNDGYWTNVWTKKPFCTAFWAGRPTEDWMFSQVYAKGVAWNDTHWDNERFNALLVQARVELDEAKRREMYREMQLIVRDDGGVIIPMYANYVDARSRRIAHAAQVGSNYELDGWKCIERWWVA